MSATLSVPAVTDATFAREVAAGLVAVDFTADWCPPCRLMAPVVEAIAQEYAPRVRVLQMDADTNPATVARYGVRGLPSLLLFRDGALVERIVGATPVAAVRARFAPHVGA